MTHIDLAKLEDMYRSSLDVNERFELTRQYRSYLEKWLEQNPKDIQALTHLGMLCWEPFHEKKKAITYLEKAIQYDPKNIDARFWLAKCYYHDYCAYEKAIQIASEALQIDPSRADCLAFLAMVVEDTTQNWNEAIAYLKRAIQSKPNWPAPRFFLASLYLQTGDIVSAEEQIQKIQELSTQPFEKPKNGIEAYYEAIVTCRSRVMERLEQFKEKIRQAKAR